jgi:hypothetical protein
MESLLSGAPLYYPSAKEWMWDYCIYLGPFSSEDDRNYDLGIFLGDTILGPSAAIVYGDEPGNYISGELKNVNKAYPDYYRETVKRAKALNLIK